MSRTYNALLREKDNLLMSFSSAGNDDKPKLLVKIMDIEKEIERAKEYEQ